MQQVSEVDQLRREAAAAALALVQSGMVVGLGVGRAASEAIRLLARRLREGALTDIVGIPCSLATEALARSLAIPLGTLDEHPVVDLTLDGADEVDPALNLIKGGGGALLREKIVAQASRREVIIVDAGKRSPVLGAKFHLPIEVAAFGWRPERDFLVSLGATVTRRQAEDGSLFLTDQGNPILDARFGPINDPAALAARLDARAGVVGHGLFVGLATDVFTGTSDGVQHERRTGERR